MCSGDWQRTFAPGNDVVIGRDVRADVRVPDPLVSRAHVVLRCLDGRWVAIDNASRNGIFVEHRRVHSVDGDGETINIGGPDGPGLTLELALTLPDRVTFSARPGTLTAAGLPLGASRRTSQSRSLTLLNFGVSSGPR